MTEDVWCRGGDSNPHPPKSGLGPEGSSHRDLPRVWVGQGREPWDAQDENAALVAFGLFLVAAVLIAAVV